MQPSKPTVISVFSGAGGIDYGLEAAGFETRVCVDFDHDACETIRHNRLWPVIESDVFDLPTPRLLSEAALRSGEADILAGGPPCQPFSKSGYWSSGDSLRLDDPRAATLAAFMRIWEETLPKVVIFENVRGFAYAGKSEALEFIRNGIERINSQAKTSYRAATAIVQAADYGVPQSRERFVLVASRDGISFEFPTPTHAAVSGASERLPLEPITRRYMTAWDAIGDLPGPARNEDLRVRGKWSSLLPSVPEGQNYLYHTDRRGGLPLFGWRRRFWSFLLKLAKDRPSWTIQAQPGPAVGPFHWYNRRLSARELSRLQTLPDDVEIKGGRGSLQRQIGNAVPSLLMEVLGRAIREQLLEGDAPRRDLILLPSDRSPVPPPEPVDPVPAMYRGLIGHDTPHPGTGRGRAAQIRIA